MNKALHEVEISGEYGHAKIVVDGQEIHRISGYTVEHNAGEIPTVELRMVRPNGAFLETQAEVLVENSETMARIFNREQFDEFCRLWEEHHERIEGQARDNRQN